MTVTSLTANPLSKPGGTVDDPFSTLGATDAKNPVGAEGGAQNELGSVYRIRRCRYRIRRRGPQSDGSEIESEDDSEK
jgi:hypothetical protein